ncbi:LADA_0C00540g1_1 [Lachancea dasiensis]|uniref:LADA_0C00540g1_1 n=1 Tax=Lachancea dasiensis TaxID=1072105 RepID=A0A1G4IXA5_9SACH|nr:LADA_0C00540g1_1 [Lachancea dasiensis]
MSLPEHLDTEDINLQFKKYQEQVADILQAYSANQDDALLSGFLTFAHSRCVKYIDELMAPESAPVNSAEVAQLIMDNCWKCVHYPIFKWFQLWRQHLISSKVDQKPRIVEFRKLNAKLTKFFKAIHKFYYGVIERITTTYDLHSIIPKPLLLQLNLKAGPTVTSPGFPLGNEDARAASVMFLVHGSLLNLGSCHRYKSMCEKVYNGPQDFSLFKKTMRYFNLATLVLPSVGELYLQKGLVYVHVGDFGSSTYSFARSALSRLPSSAGFANFMNSVCDRKSKIFNQIVGSFHDVHKQASQGKIVNREIIEIYFLVLFGSKFAPELWIGNDHKSLISEMMLTHVEQQVLGKTATKYARNLESIFQNLVLIIGGFDILKILNRKSSQTSNAQETESKYLAFALDYISNFIDNVVIKELDNVNEWVYLAFVRVCECWLTTNKSVLHFAHRSTKFCEVMMTLINLLLDHLSTSSKQKMDLTHRPRRPYFFEEDVMLRDFKPLKYSLCDFKDSELFQGDNSSQALIGMVDKKISKKEEHESRILAIVVSGKKFLAKNACGIQLVGDKYVRSAVKTMAGQAWDPKPSKLEKSATNDSWSIQKDIGSAKWGYSGSSVPLAPSTLDIRPSVEFTRHQKPKISANSSNHSAEFADQFLQSESSSFRANSSSPSHPISNLISKESANGSGLSSSNSQSKGSDSAAFPPPPGIKTAIEPPIMNSVATERRSPFLANLPSAPPIYPSIPLQSTSSAGQPQGMPQQSFDIPFGGNVPPHVMNSSYVPYWPQHYQPLPYNNLPPPVHGVPVKHPNVFVQQQSGSQNQPYAASYGFPQY